MLQNKLFFSKQRSIVARIFDWGVAKSKIICNDVDKNFQKGELYGKYVNN